ncbi:MAG: hypothetical protein E7589_01730 [Ruminococcaceae bacterium]|nr:hypothetical protein [Oscillospiraceae bacterium]
MPALLNDTSAEKVMRRYTKIAFFVTLVCFTLYSCVIVPLYTQVHADIMYNGGILDTVLYLLYNAMDLIVMFTVFPVTVFSVYLRGGKASAKLFVMYPVLVVYKYILNTVASYIADGALPEFDKLLSADLPLISMLVLLEVVQYALVCLAACIIITRARRVFDFKQKAASISGRMYSFRDGIFPIKRIFNFKNPVQRSAFVTAVIFFAVRAFSNLTYQFTLLVYNGFNDGWFVLVTDLLIDVGLSAVCYLVSLMVLQKMDVAQLEIAAEEEQTELRGEGIDI